MVNNVGMSDKKVEDLWAHLHWLTVLALVSNGMGITLARQGKPEQAEEYRLTFKCLPTHLDAVSDRVHALHPYSIPQWVVVTATSVSEKYLSWAQANSSPLPL